MLKFDSVPPPDPRGHALTLTRCPHMKHLAGIILSDNLLGTRTHYYHGRTVPCEHSNCPACDDGVSWRWHAWLPLWSASTEQTVLFEMTARATEVLVAYREKYGTLRGASMRAQRANSSPNSKVIIQVQPADLRHIELPPEPDILGALSIIWNIERPSISVAGLAKQAPMIHVDPDPALQQPRFNSNRSTLPSQNPNGEDS